MKREHPRGAGFGAGKEQRLMEFLRQAAPAIADPFHCDLPTSEEFGGKILTIKVKAQRTAEPDTSAPTCPECGSLLRQTGHCYTCPTCGFNTGCG